MNTKRLLKKKTLLSVVGCAGIGMSGICSAAELGPAVVVLSPSDMDRVTAGALQYGSPAAAWSNALASASGQLAVAATGATAGTRSGIYTAGPSTTVKVDATYQGGFAMGAAPGGSVATSVGGVNQQPGPSVGFTMNRTMNVAPTQISAGGGAYIGFQVIHSGSAP